MSKYTLGSVAKAFISAAVAAASTAAALAGGVDLSALDPGQWMAVLGAAFTAGGATFATPNKENTSPAERVAKDVQIAIQNQKTASAELDMVRGAIAGTVGMIPGFGPLAQQVINSVPLPFQQGGPTYDVNTAWKP